MAVRPAAGEVLVETKETRIRPVSSSTAEREQTQKVDLWDFVETLQSTTSASDPDYEFTIYRGTKSQRADQKIWLGKFYEPMTPWRIQERFGGGEFNVWLKVRVGNGRALTLKYNEEIKIGGAPKDDFAATSSAAPAAGDAMSQFVAMMRDEMRGLRDEMKIARGGDAGVRAVEQAVALSGQVFGSAATAAVGTLSKIAGADAAANGGSHPMNTPAAALDFLRAAKDLFGSPAQNSLQDTLQTLKLFKESGLIGGGGGEGKLLDRLAISLVNQLPALTNHMSGIMANYRAAEDAKVQHAALVRGVQLPVTALPAAPPPSNVVVMPPPEPQPPAPTEEQRVQAEQMLQYIEGKIVELLMNEGISAEQAANDSLTFIDVTDPVSSHTDGKNLVDQVVAHGDSGMRWVFANRPILQRVPAGERLEGFIKAFIDGAKRPPLVAQTPNPAAPPA